MIVNNKNLFDKFIETNGKLKVAIFSDAYFPLVGGASVVVRNMAEGLSEVCDVLVITGKAGKYEDDVNFPVLRTTGFFISQGIGGMALPKMDRKFKNLMKTLKIDIVHIHSFFGLAKFAIKLGKQRNIPIVFHGHSKIYDEYITITKSKFISKILARRAIKKLNCANEVWAVSEGLVDCYIRQGVKSIIKVVHNTTEFKYLEDKNFIETIKNRYNLTKKDNILMFLSRMSIKTKNIDFLIRALSKLKEANFDFTMLMIGDGPDLGNIKNMVVDFGLQDNFIFTGMIRGLEEREVFYQIADLFLFPSVVDTAGLVILEAASQKTPTLCITGSMPAEKIVDGENGYTCELDENTFAEKIIKILQDKSSLQVVGANSYITLLTNDFKNYIEQYHKVISEQIKR